MAITQPPQPVAPINSQQALATRGQGEFPGMVVGQPYGQAQEFHLRDILQLIARRWPWMLATLAIVITLGMGWTLTQPKMYASTAEMALPQSSKSAFGGIDDLPGVDQLKDLATSRTIETQIRLLQSKDFIRDAFTGISPDAREKGEAKTPNVNVTNAKNSNVIVLTVTARSPNVAADMANRMVDEFKKRDLDENRAAITTAVAYIEEEQKRIGLELQNARKRLAEFEIAHELSGTEGDPSTRYASELLALENAADQMEHNVALADETLKLLNAKMSDEDRAVMRGLAEVHDQTVDRLKQQLEELEGRRTEVLAQYVPGAPEVARVEALITAVEERLAQHLATRAAKRTATVDPERVHEQLQRDYIAASAQQSASRARVGVLRAKVGEKQRRLAELPGLKMRAAELKSDVRQFESTFASLTQSYQALRITEASRLSNVRVINAAVEERSPVSPKVVRNAALFVILGLLLAAGIAMVIESLDDRIHGQESVGRITNHPVLAYIPKVPDNEVPQLIDTRERHSSVLEGMRLLRSNLAFASIDAAARVLAVTSAGAGEGKSTTAINLAVAVAMDGKRVVVVDADLRRPSLHSYFHLTREVGLTSVVTGQATLDEALQETSTPGITLLATGPLPPNPPEVLNSQQTRALVADLAERFDMVILDTPPAAGLSDVAVIATMVQGVLMVISSNQTHKGQLRVALNTLEQVDAPLLGFIFNKITGGQGGYGYYYYYYYYQKYYAQEGEGEGDGGGKRRKKLGRG